MPHQLIGEISEVLERVVHTQKRLNELAKDESQTYPMEALQTSQSLMVGELKNLETALRKAFSPDQYKGLQAWAEVNHKAKTFGDLNRRFTDILTVRMGLIKNEVSKIRQGRKALDKMKKIYVNQNVSHARSAKRINQVL